MLRRVLFVLVLMVFISTLGMSLSAKAQKVVQNGVGNCVFSENLLAYGKEGEYQLNDTYTAGKFKGLFVRAYLPEPFTAYDFDTMVATISRPGFIDAYYQLNKKDIYDGSGFENRDSIGIWIIDPKSGKGEFAFSDRNLILQDIAEYPRDQQKKEYPITITIEFFKKVGEQYQTVWDSRSRSYITSPIPVWDKGRLVSKGTFTVIFP